MFKKAKRPKAWLCVAVFEADPKGKSGRPTRDWMWCAGYMVVIMQLIVATILWIILQAWEIFLHFVLS